MNTETMYDASYKFGSQRRAAKKAEFMRQLEEEFEFMEEPEGLYCWDYDETD